MPPDAVVPGLGAPLGPSPFAPVTEAGAVGRMVVMLAVMVAFPEALAVMLPDAVAVILPEAEADWLTELDAAVMVVCELLLEES